MRSLDLDGPYFQQVSLQETEKDRQNHREGNVKDGGKGCSPGTPSTAGSTGSWGRGTGWIPPQNLQKEPPVHTLIADSWPPER